jgi:hypothetical protein
MRIGYGEFGSARTRPASRRSASELPQHELLRGERERSNIISMGGGFVFALLCGPLLLVALIATLAVRVR